MRKPKGLTTERFNQMMALHNNDFEWVYEIINDWGVDQCNKGYAEFYNANYKMYGIERIDEVMAFINDIEAVEQAIKDGIKIIPVEELPSNFPNDLKFLGWIDNEHNRKQLAYWV